MEVSVEISKWDEIIEELITFIELREEEVAEMKKTLAMYRAKRDEDSKK